MEEHLASHEPVEKIDLQAAVYLLVQQRNDGYIFSHLYLSYVLESKLRRAI